MDEARHMMELTHGRLGRGSGCDADSNLLLFHDVLPGVGEIDAGYWLCWLFLEGIHIYVFYIVFFLNAYRIFYRQ